MQHKFFLLILVLLLLLSACVQKDAGYLLNPDEPSKLIVNVLWNTNDSTPYVDVHRTGALTVQEVTDYQCELYVNGFPMPQRAGDPSSFYYRPQPGDHVELQVKADGETAKATVDVPQPLIIEGMDTLHVRKMQSHDSDKTDPYVRFLIHVRQPEGMRGMQFFRLEHERQTWNFCGGSEGPEYREGKYYYVVQYYYQQNPDRSTYEYDFDSALSENASNMSDDNDDYTLELFDEVPNKYGLFRNNFFRNGRYTLCIDVPIEVYSVYKDSGYLANYTFRILTLPKIEYYYLWAATAVRDVYEPGVLLSNPPIVPTNIEGGTGVFSVSAAVQVSLSDNQLPAGSVLNEFGGYDYYHEEEVTVNE